MSLLVHLVERGGPVMVAIIALSVLLYSRCCYLLVELWRAHRSLVADKAATVHDLNEVQFRREDVQSLFRRERVVLGSMIAAAPLLGLLGTVNGMVKTFASLVDRDGERSMEGLARGISEVLVATESGLLVAIPALLIVCVAHHGMRRNLRELNRIEARLRLKTAP